jgi:copper chaperone CopZ
MNSENKYAGLGFLTAIAASLCCITPVVALLAGTSGLASTFSWLDGLRPYLIGLTILMLGLAWFQKLRPQKKSDCACDTIKKKPFIHTKRFLGLITLLTGLLLTFPLYAHLFYPKAKNTSSKTSNTTIIANESKIEKASFSISGMTCSGCETHVQFEINKLAGIINTSVSYEKGNALVEFDQTKTTLGDIEKAISKTGYTVTGKTAIK